MRVCITGAGGYVGAMLVDQFLDRNSIDQFLLIDKSPMPDFLKIKINSNSNFSDRIEWIEGNLCETAWQSKFQNFLPDVVIHTAWQIREMFGQKKKQWDWNVNGSTQIFDMVFSTNSVQKLVYFSTASVYGAFKENTFAHKFTEDEPMRENEYLYGVEKRKVDELLKEKYLAKKNKGQHVPQIMIVRPSAITGPRGRYLLKGRFGLQSALTGRLTNSPTDRLVKIMLSVMPTTKLWCRQFIHEDDVKNIIEIFAFTSVPGVYEIYNITPPGPIVTAPQMAKIVGKKILNLPNIVIRIVFAFFWNVFRGRIPTSKGGWKFYAFPIVLDGSKITRKLGYTYLYDSLDAIGNIKGRYAKYVSNEEKSAAETRKIV